MNSKYYFTDRKEHQFYKTLLENFNSTKFGEERMASFGSTYIS